ncbi:MAG: type 4 pilus major pilin [Pseudomonadota bacterium]|nr:type 4 pilus major pilin [Pseudomonadota bacterium]
MKEANLKKQKGFTLVELAIVLAIIAALTLYKLSDSDESNAQKDGMREVSLTVQSLSKIRSYFDTAKVYTDLDNTVALNAPLIPKAMNLNGSIVNTFKQTVTLAPATLNGVTNLGLTWTTQYPKENCSFIVGQLEPEMAIVSVGGTIVKPLNGTLDMRNLATRCQSSNLVNIVYTTY